MVLMADLWQSALHTVLVPSSLPAMLTAAVLVMLLVAVTVATAPRTLASLPVIRVAALREKSRHAVCLRQCDPDADGHARPRAPSAALAAA